MSYRTLIEINHDFIHAIERDPEQFVKSLRRALDDGLDLGRFGVRFFGRRHHTDPFSIDWGGIEAGEPRTRGQITIPAPLDTPGIR